ncbi:putative C6 transcription factor [Aspergillus clavatus NRRL 1]|uniref:C6 transcription factor, putative n=1 Tax=Aspergillus clavatus (strain ATCC 1007 / CBS 513.65 / DSM 816 / NCTC 3887 / NRRL 1 / QM 1276 / 107) TaxID=344612 RepID=A1CU51_ASPCL|nr:C6 transcription factor, putative [Aspergillus clavatus NRRL 1]EAW06838.1 C6 transcription factor, putative [Aspergillus clavatus NRRL 1]
MFHTFEIHRNEQRTARDERRGRRPGLRACKECRRRKIRCTGTHPCEPCLYYKKPELCRYSDPRVPRRTLDDSIDTANQYRSVVEQLFPSAPVQSLVSLSREELLALLRDSILVSDGPTPQLPETPGTDQNSHPSQDDSLENTDGNESNDVSDDVNALSTVTRAPSTYLGISSINAVFQVLKWIDPESLELAAAVEETPSPGPAGGRSPSLTKLTNSVIPQSHSTQSNNDLQLLDAYFDYIHPSMPLVDERDFRQTYLAGTRQDDQWLALLNMVLALGSIALYPGDDPSHIVYCKRVRSYLSLESLGTAHLETVQTLGLMAGHYLHYISQPNLAYVLIGAAVRMATALGLHKENADIDESESRPLRPSVPVELRRRIWWSLYCLDTWGSMTLGRPTLGRSSLAVTTRPPVQTVGINSSCTLILVENIRYCQIATRIQEALAASPLIPYSQLQDFDNELLDWYEQLPALLKSYEPCSDSIYTARTRMQWSLHNLRILLYRPVLLSFALRRVPYVALHTEQRLAIDKCRMLANDAIRDIAQARIHNPTAAWGVIWHLFQATLVPLLSLSVVLTNTAPITDADRELVLSCREQVEITIGTISRIEAWHPTARKSLSLISRILAATKVRFADPPPPIYHPQTQPPNQPQSQSQPHSQAMNPALQVPVMTGMPSIYTENELSLPSQEVWDYISWTGHRAWPDTLASQVPNPDFWSAPGWWQ